MKSLCLAPILALILAMFSSVPAMAEVADISNLSLEDLLKVEIVTSASKFAQKITEAPSAVRVITAADIRNYGWRTLGDALATLPGITQVGDRSYSFLGARGLLIPGDYNTRFQLLIDGTPQNDAILETAYPDDVFPIDMALIERIEYVPGPGSAIYGANAMFGVINVFTKSAKDRHSTEIAASVDSVGRRTARATVAQQLSNGASLTLSATALRKIGQDESYPDIFSNSLVVDRNGNSPQSDIAHGLDRDHKNQFFGKLEYEGFKLNLIIADRSNHPSSALYGSNFDDPALENRDRHLSLSASYTRDIATDFKLYTNLAYQDVWYNGIFPLFSEDTGRHLYYESDHAARWYGETRLSTTLWQNHQTLLGLDFSHETTSKLFNYDQHMESDPVLDSNRRDTRFGLYAQDDWSFAQNWRLNAGMRFDHSEMYGDHYSPRLGLIWQTTPELTLKALAGRAFRNPSRYESHYRTTLAGNTDETRDYQQNLNLKAETINTYELVADWRPNNRLQFTGSLYHYHLYHVISQTSVEVNDQQFQNLYNIDTTGLETSVRYRLGKQWKLDASLALQHAEKNYNIPLDNSAGWIAKLALDGPLWQDKLFVAWELHANGPTMQEWTASADPVTANTSSIVVSNLAFTARNMLPGAEMQLRINNLFDHRYTTPGSADTPVAQIPTYGRNAMLSLRYEF